MNRRIENLTWLERRCDANMFIFFSLIDMCGCLLIEKKFGETLLWASLSFGVPLYPANIHFGMSIKMPDNIVIECSSNKPCSFRPITFSFSLSSNANEFNATKWNISKSEIRIFLVHKNQLTLGIYTFFERKKERNIFHSHFW